MAQMTDTGMAPLTAATTILIAAASNGAAKAVLGMAFGGWKLGTALCALAFLASIAGTLTYFFAR
jgi:hypothetical protein